MNRFQRFEDIDTNRARCVDVRSVVKLFDFGPQPPSVVGVPAQADARRMRAYEKASAQWVEETNGQPVAVNFNSCDASEAKLYDPKRWRTSATATTDEIPAQQTTTTPQFVYIAGCGGQAALPCGHLSDLLNPGVTLVLFSARRRSQRSKTAFPRCFRQRLGRAEGGS
jgi:hypothetical protein